MIIDEKNSCLVVIDVQDRLVPVMDNPRDVINNTASLVSVFGILDLPVISTLQNPDRLGEFIVDVRLALDEYSEKTGKDVVRVEKSSFSCLENNDFKVELEKSSKKQVVLCGVEAHICVLQTALDLVKVGYEVYVVADACSSREKYNEMIAYQRMSEEGVKIVTKEMVMFELVGDYNHTAFKEIQSKVR